MFWLLRNFSGSRKAGFVAAVSDFALIVLKAMDGSFAQCGMRPHFIPESCRLFRVLGDHWDKLRGSDIVPRTPIILPIGSVGLVTSISSKG